MINARERERILEELEGIERALHFIRMELIRRCISAIRSKRIELREIESILSQLKS